MTLALSIGLVCIVLGILGLSNTFRLFRKGEDNVSLGFGSFYAGAISITIGMWLVFGTLIVRALVYIIHVAKS